MANVLFIIAPNNFRDEELLEPKEILQQEHTIHIASTTTGTCTGSLGAQVEATLTLQDALRRLSDFAVVIFVGGTGSNIYHNNSTAHQLAQQAATSKKILAAICWASVTLAKAGVLTNKKMTGWIGPEKKELLIFEQEGAKYTGKDVEHDSNIITANGPHAALLFGQTIKEALRART